MPSSVNSLNTQQTFVSGLSDVSNSILRNMTDGDAYTSSFCQWSMRSPEDPAAAAVSYIRYEMAKDERTKPASSTPTSLWDLPITFAGLHVLAPPTLPPPTPPPSLQSSVLSPRPLIGKPLTLPHPLQFSPPKPQHPQFVQRSTEALPNIGPSRECRFCKNNGETVQLYKSHVLRNPSNGVLICPVLREHICEICGATGDEAHTRNYCPQIKLRLRQALPIHLKRTRRQSDGNIR